MISRDIDSIASLNEDNIEEITEVGEEKLRQQEERTDRIGIICTKCKGRVGYIIPAKTDLPLRGSMIHPHLGCEGWPLPKPFHTPKDFVCPHAVDGDGHLFVNVIEGQDDLTNFFLDENHRPFQITKSSGLCPCGCGDPVRGGNQYAHGLECYRRYMAKAKE